MADSERHHHEMLTLYTYGISPSWVIAVMTAFLFACVMLVHFFQILIKRVWYLIPLLIGSFVEILGYGFRAHGLHEMHIKLSTYVASSTFIVIAPAFIAASLYQLLAHIVLTNGHGGSGPMFKCALGLGLGTLDVLAFSLQAAGAAKLSDPFVDDLTTTLKHAHSIVLAGNIINLIVLILFLALTVYFHIAILSNVAGFCRLYNSIGLLVIRVLYRVVTYSGDIVDHHSPSPSPSAKQVRVAGSGEEGGGGGGLKETRLFHERWLYGLDALLIFLLLVLISASYPSRNSLGEVEREGDDQGLLEYYFGRLRGLVDWIR